MQIFTMLKAILVLFAATVVAAIDTTIKPTTFITSPNHNPFGTSAERSLTINLALSKVVPPTSLLHRRQLIEVHGEEHANKVETFENIMDERSHHLQVSKVIATLQNIGYEKKDLPFTKDGYVNGFHDASERMMLRIHELEKAAEKEKAENELKHRRLYPGMPPLKTSRSSSQTPDLTIKPRRSRYLGEIRPGVHEVSLGTHMDEIEFVDSSSGDDEAKRHLAGTAGDLAGQLGTCTEKANGHVYAFGLSTNGMVASGTACTCKTIQDAATVKEVVFPARFCECNEKTSSFNGYAMYSFTKYTCDQYPGLAPSSKCTIDTAAFPKSIRCDYVLVIAEQFSTTFSTEFKVGYGATGLGEDLVAELSVGMFSSNVPEPCPLIPLIGGFPNIPGYMYGTSAVNAAMALCNALAYCAKKAAENEPSMDLGQTMFGARGAGTMSIVPFQFRYPKAYKSTTDALQPLARIPLLAGKANEAGVDVSGIDFSKPVCLSDIGDKFKQGGGIKRPLQAMGAAIKMMGADFCFQLPGLDATGTDLIFGLKMKMIAFNKDTVDMNNFLNLLPKAWNTMTKDMTGGEGVKDLMSKALNLKPLSSCSVCPSALKTASINSKIKDFVTTFWPAKFEKEIDIGAIIGKVTALKSIMKDGKLFKFPNMFTKASRRRMLSDSPNVFTPPIIHSLPVGPLGTMDDEEDQHLLRFRSLAADSTLKFKYKTFVLEGSQCALTIKTMPKKITCNLKLQMGKMNAEIDSEFELSYDLNGVDLVVISRAKVKAMVGTKEDYKDITGADKLAKIDIGGLIDDSLAGTISMIPVGIEFPKTGLFTIARVKISMLKDKGICLGAFEDVAPPAQKPDVKNVGDILKKVLGFIGGDVCVKSPGVELNDGFKIDVNGVLTMFDPSKINIYPIIDAIKLVEPSIATVVTAIQTVFGEAIKTAMNTAAKKVAPKQVDFTVNMGKLIAAATDAAAEAAAITGAKLPTRRLEAAPIGGSGADGKFDLGGVAKSSNPSSKDNGDPKKAEAAAAAAAKNGGAPPGMKGQGGDYVAGCVVANGTSTGNCGGCGVGCGFGIFFLILFFAILPLSCLGAYCLNKRKYDQETEKQKDNSDKKRPTYNEYLKAKMNDKREARKKSQADKKAANDAAKDTGKDTAKESEGTKPTGAIEVTAVIE